MTAAPTPSEPSWPTVESTSRTIHPSRWTARAIELTLDRDALRPSDVVAIQLRRREARLPLDEREESTALALSDDLARVRDLWFLDPTRAEQHHELYELTSEDLRVVLAVLLAHLVDTFESVSLGEEANDLIWSYGRGGRFEELVSWAPMERGSRAWLARRRGPLRDRLREAILEEAERLRLPPDPGGGEPATTALTRGALERWRLRRDLYEQADALVPSDELLSSASPDAGQRTDAMVMGAYLLQGRMAELPWATRDALGRRLREDLAREAGQLSVDADSAGLVRTASRLRVLRQSLQRYG